LTKRSKVKFITVCTENTPYADRRVLCVRLFFISSNAFRKWKFKRVFGQFKTIITIEKSPCIHALRCRDQRRTSIIDAQRGTTTCYTPSWRRKTERKRHVIMIIIIIITYGTRFPGVFPFEIHGGDRANIPYRRPIDQSRKSHLNTRYIRIRQQHATGRFYFFTFWCNTLI